MTLRETTIHNSVKYVPLSEKSKKKRLSQKQQKLVHFLVNKSKLFRRTIRNSLKIFQHQDSNILQISICTSIRINTFEYVYL